MAESKSKFLGAYFDVDNVLRISRALAILSWVFVGIYAFDFVLGAGVVGLQYVRGLMGGMGFTDQLQNLVYLLERPLHGIIYFGVLQAISKGLLIALEVEENTRRGTTR